MFVAGGVRRRKLPGRTRAGYCALAPVDQPFGAEHLVGCRDRVAAHRQGARQGALGREQRLGAELALFDAAAQSDRQPVVERALT